MASCFEYSLLWRRVITILFSWFDKSCKPMPLVFTDTTMVMGGLAVLQSSQSELVTYSG